jgi:signal transduction histidine kinase
MAPPSDFMNIINVAGLINLLGYTIGIALYALLFGMVLRHSALELRSETSPHSKLSANWLMLATATLGLLWNIGAFATYGLKGFGLVLSNVFPVLSSISFSALGFLPAVVVQSVILNRLSQPVRLLSRLISIAAYCLSSIAAVLFFYAALIGGTTPSPWALTILTFGYLALLAMLIVSTRRNEGWKKAVWATALAVFTVTALHLGHHRGGETDAWYTELAGHHASLLLAFAILYEDYRFAFADIFLKRALSLLALIAVALGLYFGVGTTVLSGHNWNDPRAFGVLLGLWVVTGLTYPALRKGVNWFVDTVILSRPNYSILKIQVAQLLSEHETEDDVMTAVCLALAPAISARNISWQEAGASALIESHGMNESTSVEIKLPEYVLISDESGKGAQVFVPTAEPPYYLFDIATLDGGRRLLSDDIAMLESIAVLVARRIDALRVTHERCEQNLREQEINKLATEAQLRALRAQVNPHFLFNALTTLGHLIQTSPDRALETLMKLTSLLRGVLRTEGEFVTLGEELKLIGSYLDIESARFEERLRVSIDVPEELLTKRLPSLLVQPLVENAIKHGITPSRFGGEVSICARLEQSMIDGGANCGILSITVIDTGIGASEIEMARGRKRGVGLSNIEERLRFYGGKSASLKIRSTLGAGTVVELRMPATFTEAHAGASLPRKMEKKA